MQLLCNDGTICNAPPALLTHLFLQFHEIELFTGDAGSWATDYLDICEYPGETLAYVTDNNQLVVLSPWVSETVIKTNLVEPKELTLTEYAKKHNRSREMIKALLRDGRIPGAVMRGMQWFIPENAPYPVDVSRRKPDAGRISRRTED